MLSKKDDDRHRSRIMGINKITTRLRCIDPPTVVQDNTDYIFRVSSALRLILQCELSQTIKCGNIYIYIIYR